MLQGKIQRVLNKRKGFALLDVLLGTAIITIALLGIAFAYRQSTVTTVAARNYNQATYYAQQALELLKVNDGKTIAVTPDSIWTQPNFPQIFTTNTIPVNGEIPASGTMPKFTVKTVLLTAVQVTEASSMLKPVKATVEWDENVGAGTTKRSVSIVSYYYLYLK